MSEVFFFTDLCRHHTFCGGVSRVDRAMAEKTRSRSPIIAKKEASSVPPEVLGPKGADEDEKLSEGKTGGLPKSDELPEASLTETIQEAPEESTGRLIVDTMLAAARTLETCAGNRTFGKYPNRWPSATKSCSRRELLRLNDQSFSSLTICTAQGCQLGLAFQSIGQNTIERNGEVHSPSKPKHQQGSFQDD